METKQLKVGDYVRITLLEEVDAQLGNWESNVNGAIGQITKIRVSNEAKEYFYECLVENANFLDFYIYNEEALTRLTEEEIMLWKLSN